MNTYSKTIRTQIFALALLFLLASFAQAQDKPQKGGSGGLSGTASWPMELVREYVKKEYKVDVPPQPAPWRNQDMAAHLNGEFVKRLNALMAIYQVLGGDTNLGIERPTGGLRSAEEQIELFKQCRRIKRRYGLGQPIGDGSKASDWEVIPENERYRKGETVINIIGAGKVIFENKSADICGTGTVTDAWVSWHNVGLAADLVERSVDKKSKVQEGPPTTDAWLKLTHMVGELGMTWGGWWDWDRDHVEFHPQMFSAESAGPSGQPLPDDKLHTQYAWKLPETVFWYEVNKGNVNGNNLRVYTFGTGDDGTITLKAFRTITGEQDGKWSGNWETFDPPIPLFPAYIPTIGLYRNVKAYPDDAKFDSDTTVTSYTYSKILSSDGKESFDWRRLIGKAHYTIELKMENLQFEANRAYGMSVPSFKTNRPEYDRIRKLWHYLVHTSVYDLRADLRDDDRELMQQTGRRSDRDGYTEELDYPSVNPGFPILIEFGWDRDGGKVGSDSVTAREQEGQYLLTEASPMGPVTVSDKLPPGAWDMPEPIQEPSANPKPKDKKKPNKGGFLRP